MKKVLTEDEQIDKWTNIAPIANAIHTTGKFSAVQCIEIAEGILQYMEDTGIELTLKYTNKYIIDTKYME